MAVPKLYYFDGPGAAEPIRMTYVLSGKEFEDVRVTNWPGDKPKSPTGMLPYMTLEDGKTVIVESAAILAYAGRTTGMLPTDPVEEAKALMIAFFPSNLVSLIRSVRHAPEDKRAEAAKQATEKLPELCKAYENMVKGIQTKPGFALGDKFTVADAGVYFMVNGVQGHNPMNFKFDNVEKECPTLYGIYQNVAAQKNVQDYLAKHKPKQ